MLRNRRRRTTKVKPSQYAGREMPPTARTATPFSFPGETLSGSDEDERTRTWAAVKNFKTKVIFKVPFRLFSARSIFSRQGRTNFAKHPRTSDRSCLWAVSRLRALDRVFCRSFCCCGFFFLFCNNIALLLKKNRTTVLVDVLLKTFTCDKDTFF